MGSDKHVESNHRKHRRSSSSSDEVVKSAKRYKDRHHHKHQHSHHRRDEEYVSQDEEYVSQDPYGVGNGGELEMEEGEISNKRLERGRSSDHRDSSRGVRDRDNDRGGRNRDKARSTSRETGTRENERDRGRRELESDREKHKTFDDGYGEVRQKHSSRHDAEDELEIRSSSSLKEGHDPNGERSKADRHGEVRQKHSRHDAEDALEIRSSSSDLKEGHDPNGERSKTDGHGEVRQKQSRHDAEDELEIRSSSSLKEGHDPNGERSKTDGHDVNVKDLVWFFDQEAEDLKIIEQSRRKIQEVYEKRKKELEQSSSVADALGSGGTLGPVASTVKQAKAEVGIDVVDNEVAKLSSAVCESPARLVISDSDRTLASVGLGEDSPKSNTFIDDIFGESPAAGTRKGNGLLPFVRSGLNDNWDDSEGYYSYQLGELLDNRYEIMATHGKGVFSTVVRAKDTKAEESEPEEVAIKIIRNNETMHKAGQAEIRILNKLAGSDPENKHHCVRLLSTFKYRNHLCLVFESLHLNLREVVKKIGVNVGLQLSDVRLYAEQLFISLKHLKNCGVLHCDIKPDNILVNEGRNMLKLCDFGSAMFAGENELTPYLASRFYRAPEIILGLAYDHPLDMWSVGCCLYELYSGKIMFPGSTNNDMLRLHMELKGPFPKKMLRKGAFIDQHFDQDLCFYGTEEDSVSGKTVRRMMVNIKPKDLGSVIRRRYEDEDPKVLVHFRNLLDKIFTLDPQKRLTVSQALAHPFITGK
ncbi:PREDICTED: serine/threonine-protein kinase prp4-like [Camelina sativa]|uniref:non-specific serine/threonine protein kinase n=1 Tax=Camelina sativa TaxID=90675 RepID=A0ABM0TTW3_CAMSA|nr:PREDICTED: serine/threonine-protein kinase prp4-like [Camelina sativa]